MDPSAQRFDYIPGTLTQISVGGDGDVWGNTDSQVWHYLPQQQTWQQVGGVNGLITQISVGNDGAVYLLNNFSPDYYTPYWYNPGADQFQAVPGQYNPVPFDGPLA
jgi:hypothetical protein